MSRDYCAISSVARPSFGVFPVGMHRFHST
jgi:hypothetical protein